MTTLLDHPSLSPGGWRASAEALSSDAVFRSAVQANFAPYFARLQRALHDARTLTELQAAHSRDTTKA